MSDVNVHDIKSPYIFIRLEEGVSNFENVSLVRSTDQVGKFFIHFVFATMVEKC